MFSELFTLSFLIFCFLSVLYVYKFRGQSRFSNGVEYLRKGWPIFAPLNVLLYLSTKPWARKPFVQVSAFNKLEILEENWQVIAEEAIGLYKAGYFNETTNRANKSYYDVGFRTFYKYGWSKFYCTWYGTTLNSALAHCPKTVALLEQIPSVNGAMFTLLPANSKLTRHLDPVACSLRYHLGLATPNSDQCYINIDGQSKTWYDGKAFVFDETYLHFVENHTSEMRLILMCDLERPMGFSGKVVNWFYKKLVRMMQVPNLPGDQAGPINAIFGQVTPFLNKAKQLKQTKPSVYYPLKWTFNTGLLIGLFSVFYFLLSLMALLTV
ncbi:aspartyl/asparaginyl beta-hydroxylase domain-containing protein [Pseudoalteromonas sp. T1lg65]|uniref:aspartyl/asparaginyl beta-hydroxylase domain-containing protein n=1 Tax=Pseudoalteromonas sp. T1lg65 TaxID=2077101 RepID=UPI003F796997